MGRMRGESAKECRRGRWKQRGEEKPGRGGESQCGGRQDEERQGVIRQEEIQSCWRARASSVGTRLLVPEQQDAEQPGEGERREEAEGQL